MRKNIVEHRTTEGRSQSDAEWLDLDLIAHVQLTSEDPAFPDRKCARHKPREQ